MALKRGTTAETLSVRELLADSRLDRASLRSHPQGLRCPSCKVDMNRVAIVDIVYAYETCSCDAAPYQHLREQLWHRKCFLEANLSG